MKYLDVGTIIRTARIAKGYTQEELGEIVGVQKSAVAKWENGRVSEIKRSNLKKLADALGLQPTDLLEDIEDSPIETADFLADVFWKLDQESKQMINEYISLDGIKKAQVREYVHLLSSVK